MTILIVPFGDTEQTGSEDNVAGSVCNNFGQ